MKEVLFFISGGLAAAWLITVLDKNKKPAAKAPGAGIVDIVEIEKKPDPIMPSTMVKQFDASDHATVSPASVKIVGAGALDDMDHFNATMYRN